jgi:hypothetical protein
LFRGLAAKVRFGEKRMFARPARKDRDDPYATYEIL